METNTAAPKSVPSAKLLWRKSCLAPTWFSSGEGRSPVGRNGQMHYRSSRGMGSGIQGKFLRDNVGKVLLPAGAATTSKDPPYRVNS